MSRRFTGKKYQSLLNKIMQKYGPDKDLPSLVTFDASEFLRDDSDNKVDSDKDSNKIITVEDKKQSNND